MNAFLILFFRFFLYSFIGWIIETIYVSIKNKKIANRGFLIGPYCPIYGLSAILMTYLLSNYKNDILILFIVGLFIASLLEYITSLLLEKIFKARWWDYSDHLLNIDGRVCLFNSLLFGILCIFLVQFLDPTIVNFINNIPENIRFITSIMFLIIFTGDTLLSYITIFKLERLAFIKYELKKDYTEEIAKKVKTTLLAESRTFRRLLKAFPNLNILNKFKVK